jgi:hypothetical protein
MQRLILLTVALLMVLATTALADRGDRIEHRLDQRGDTIRHRFEHKAQRALERDRPRLAERFLNQGERIDRHLDRKGAYINHRLDRRGERIRNRYDLDVAARRLHRHDHRRHDQRRPGVVYPTPRGDSYGSYCGLVIRQPGLLFGWGFYD